METLHVPELSENSIDNEPDDPSDPDYETEEWRQNVKDKFEVNEIWRIRGIKMCNILTQKNKRNYNACHLLMMTDRRG